MIKEVVIANRNWAEVQLDDTKSFDRIAFEVIREDRPPFLLPMKMMNIDGRLGVRYELSGGVRLSYLPMQMQKKELLQLLRQMLSPFLECIDWFLDYHAFYLEKDYILYDKNTAAVQYIYLPDISQGKSEEDILDFFRTLIMEAELSDEPAYTLELLRQIMGKDAKILKLLDFMKEEEKRSSAKGQEIHPYTEAIRQDIGAGKQTDPAGQAISRKETADGYTDSRSQEDVADLTAQNMAAGSPAGFGKKDTIGPLGEALLGDSPKKAKTAKVKKDRKEKKEKSTGGFLGGLLGSKAKGKQQEQPIQTAADTQAIQSVTQESRSMVFIDPTEYILDNRTEVFEDTDTVKESSGMRLVLVLEEGGVRNAPERIELDLSKGFVTIGRYDKTGRKSADYNFDISMTFISRQHMRFETDGAQYYLIDLGSQQHTYLNEQELLMNVRYPVKTGDIVMISGKHRLCYRIC